jgi:hypothetical protein
MARFYAHYQNTTQSDLEATSGDNYYTKRFVNTTNAATTRTNLIAARAALSTSFYADIASASNKNGNLGIVVPADGYTNNGTTVSGANIYTDTTPAPGAVWQSDPRTRPTSQILVANTESTIVDAWDVPTTEYNTCLTELGNYLNGIYTSVALSTLGGPYNRTSLSPWRMLASIWHDHSLTYFAWDDFTPGQPTLNPLQPGSQPAANQLDITLNWSWEYTNDRRGNIRMNECYLVKTSGGALPNYNLKDTSGVDIFNTLRTSSTGTLVARVPGGTLPAGNYQLFWNAQFADAAITSNYGTEATYTSGTSFIVLT